MKKTLIIVRHGNTFLPFQTPTRVGAGTDLPLVEHARARAAGRYICSKGYTLDKISASPLKRTMETACIIADETGFKEGVEPDARFVEIDYGPDENKTENEVMLRLGCSRLSQTKEGAPDPAEAMELGRQVIERWNREALPPDGWKVDVEGIIKSWQDYAQAIPEGHTRLMCTSNGIIRFAPFILSENFEDFSKRHDLKVATGGVCILEFEFGTWRAAEWNVKPYKMDLL